MDALATRNKLLTRWQALKNERSSWLAHWQEIGQYLLPRAGRFLDTTANQGGKRHQKIHDNTVLRAPRVLSAGLSAGMTSPARPWLRLSTSVPELDESTNVKKWLAEVGRLMLLIFAKSNTYRVLPSAYKELGVFGSWSDIIVSDYKNVIHHHPQTIGEYAFADSYAGRVNTVFREVQLTVAQVVNEFGKDKCTQTVRTLFDSGNLDARVDVLHVIEPRSDRDPTQRDALNMPWKSVYFEKSADDGKYLRESGFKDFSALCPRWEVTSGDVYGHSPGMEALGDAIQLQHEQLRKAQGIDYQTRPPLQVPIGLKMEGANTLPGGITYVDTAGPNNTIRSLFDVRLNLEHLLFDIQDVRERINSSFYVDMFLMISNTAQRTKTATEVAELHEEKLLLIGPALERQHDEMLKPLVEITFRHMVEANIIPPPPEEMQGMDLSVEFISVLAQAQRAVTTGAIDRFVINLGSIAAVKPEVLDKFDADQWADVYADALGVDPDLIVPGNKVALIRQQRAQAAQEQAMVEQMHQRADTAAKLASANTEGKNALTDVTRAFSGYT